MSLRNKASWNEINKVPFPTKAQARGAVSRDPVKRRQARFRILQTITLVRESQQKERGCYEFPFELVDYSTNIVVKTHNMTDSEALIRNKNVKDTGYFWRRHGY